MEKTMIQRMKRDKKEVSNWMGIKKINCLWAGRLNARKQERVWIGQQQDEEVVQNRLLNDMKDPFTKRNSF